MEKIQLQAMEKDKVRLAVLGWQYRSALAKLKVTQVQLPNPKTQKEDFRGLSKKERKKLKKKNKKIEKNQKKKEDMKVIINLVNFDPKKVRIMNVPSRAIRKSKWAPYLVDFNRGKSLPPKNNQLEDHSNRYKSVRGS